MALREIKVKLFTLSHVLPCKVLVSWKTSCFLYICYFNTNATFFYGSFWSSTECSIMTSRTFLRTIEKVVYFQYHICIFYIFLWGITKLVFIVGSIKEVTLFFSSSPWSVIKCSVGQFWSNGAHPFPEIWCIISFSKILIFLFLLS